METKISVHITEDMRRHVEEIAAQQGTSMSDVVRSALEEYIEEIADVAFADKVERRLAEGKERLYSHEEVWAEIDELQP